jgi:transcription antitermination factor NusG
MSINNDEGHWYAVRVKPNCERVAATSLSSKGFEHCLPVRREEKRWSDRFKTVERPLFPGYVFCRFDFGRRVAVLSTPGVLYVVCFGGVPAAIEAAEIAAVRAIVTSGLAVEPWPYLENGQRVWIEKGPIAGVGGVVLDSKSGSRLIVSVTMLRRSVAVEVDADWVRPLSRDVRGSSHA